MIPLVSIIIPVYNGSNYLREAIDSALAQTYANIEILVINDGSNDNGKTKNIAKSYGKKIRYFYKKNGGVASALNLGIKNMKGTYFSWLSHDDLYYSDKIRIQMKYLKNKSQIAYCDYENIDKNLNFIEKVQLKKVASNRMLEYLLKHSIIHGCSLLIPKYAFNKFGVFNKKLMMVQDYELWFKFLEEFKFIYVPEVLVKSRKHSEQGGRVLVEKFADEKNKLFIWLANNFSKEFYKKHLKSDFPWYYLKFFLYYKHRNFEAAAEFVISEFCKSFKKLSKIDFFSMEISKQFHSHFAFKKYHPEIFFKIGEFLRKKKKKNYRKYFDHGILIFNKKNNSLHEVQILASYLKKQRFFNESQYFFKKVLKKSPDKQLIQSSNFHLGEISLHQKNKKLAESYFKTCILLNPLHCKAKEYLSKLKF